MSASDRKQRIAAKFAATASKGRGLLTKISKLQQAVPFIQKTVRTSEEMAALFASAPESYDPDNLDLIDEGVTSTGIDLESGNFVLPEGFIYHITAGTSSMALSANVAANDLSIIAVGSRLSVVLAGVFLLREYFSVNF
jgi:hypothetical protein